MKKAKSKFLISNALMLALVAIVSGILVLLSIVGGIGIGIPIASLIIEKDHNSPNANTKTYVPIPEYKYMTASTQVGINFVSVFFHLFLA